MAKKKKISAKGSQSQWPSERELAAVRERLSGVEGSTVLGNEASLTDRIKQNLCSKIVEYHVKNKVTQKDLAAKLGVDEPEMSRILHYKLGRYTIDRLVGYLEVLYPNVDFEVFAA